MSKRFTDDAEMNVGLTDDEIVKALDVCYNSPCCTNECPYFNKNGRNFCAEDKAFYRDMKRIAQKLAEKDKKIEYYKDREKSFVNAVEKLTKEKSELKAEIERLTEENEYLDMVAKQALTDYQNTQVQVDELTDKLGKVLSRIKADELLVAKGIEQAVKDTAKEIYDFAKGFFTWDEEGFVRELKEFVQDYDVEVE